MLNTLTYISFIVGNQYCPLLVGGVIFWMLRRLELDIVSVTFPKRILAKANCCLKIH